MKRTVENLDCSGDRHPQEHDSKKLKITKQEENKQVDTLHNVASYSWSKLSHDELSIVLQFLPVGSVLMFAMTCKDNHDWIDNLIKSNICKYFIPEQMKRFSNREGNREFYSLVNGLRQKNSLRIGESNIEKVREVLEEIAARNGSFCEVSNKIIIDSDDFPLESLFNLLDIRKVCKDDQSSEMKIETRNMNNRSKVVKSISAEPVGYDLKGLTLNLTLTKEQLFQILSKFRNLETLSLQIEQRYNRNTDEETNELLIPVMKNLKTLNVQKCFDEHDNVLLEIVAICPNLEHLSFICSDSVGDDFLRGLCNHLKKLKTLKIHSSDAATQFELEITDRGLESFLTEQLQIESIDLEPASSISGSIFKKLGEFPTLKHFRTQRACYNGDMVRQEQDLYFGGDPNPNLEFMDIGKRFEFAESDFDKILSSLKTFAPNLKHLREFGQVFDSVSPFNQSRGRGRGRIPLDVNQKIAQTFGNSLERMELNSKTLSLLPLYTQLKTVSVCEIGEEVNEPGLENLDANTCSSIPTVTHLINSPANGFSILSKLFPNLKTFESEYGNVVELVDYLIEHGDCLPNLVHFKTPYGADLERYEKLASQRPHLFIEVVDDSELEPKIVSPQVFYYQWLQRE